MTRNLSLPTVFVKCIIAFLLPPDLKAWLPEDDLAHFVVAAVDRVPVGLFEVPARTGASRSITRG